MCEHGGRVVTAKVFLSPDREKTSPDFLFIFIRHFFKFPIKFSPNSIFVRINEILTNFGPIVFI